MGTGVINLKAVFLCLMKPPKLLSTVYSILSVVGVILPILMFFGIIPERITYEGDFLQQNVLYLMPLATLVFGLSILWLGYRIGAWHTKKGGRLNLPILTQPIPDRTLEGIIKRTRDVGKVWVLGYHHWKWSEDDLSVWVKSAITKRNVEFTFLFSKPRTDNFQRAMDAELIDVGADDTNEGSRKRLRKLKNDLGADQGKVKIMLFDLPLVSSMAIGNPKEEVGGEVHVRPYLYKAGYSHRPWLVYRQDERSEKTRFEKCVESYEYALSKSWEDKQPTPQPIGSAQVKGDEIYDLTLECDVNWHLSAEIQPSPPFGSQDMVGSDRASKLHFSQRGRSLVLTGDMKCLKPSYLYYVQLAKPYTPMKRAIDTIIGAEKAPFKDFTTDSSGSGSWTLPVEVNDLTRHGIIDRFAVWVNDAPKNASVLASDNIMLRLVPQ
jgi:hypothetical protein